MIKKTVLFGLVAICLLTACEKNSSNSLALHNVDEKVDEKTSRADGLRALLEDETADSILVVAHRACWANGAPENSLRAISECIELGVDMIEIDVAITRDGVPVLMHDKTLRRTTTMSGAISEVDWDVVSGLRLRAGSGGKAAPLTQETVPTLEDALRVAKGKILINLDVKGEVFSEAFSVVKNVDVADQILMKMNAFADDAMLIDAEFIGKTLFMPIIRQCSRANTRNPCAPTLSHIIPDYDVFNPVAYEITFTSEAYFAEGVPVMQAHGGRIWVNSLAPHHAAGLRDKYALSDPDGNWGRIVALGGDIIQTDYPGKLIQYLESHKLRD